MNTLPKSPVLYAFPHIQWDALGSLRLTAQETALLRMAETNPIDYTLSDSRDASMYARVLLKLLAEAHSVGAGTGKESLFYDPFSGQTMLGGSTRHFCGGRGNVYCRIICFLIDFLVLYNVNQPQA
jgi:hypothetical protein